MVYCTLQSKDKEFLDPELPQDEKQLTTRIKAVGKEVSDMRRELETLVVDSPEHVELKDRIDVQADLRDRLINQRTNVQAGTKIVSRLTATGRARQLVPDEEHIVSTCRPSSWCALAAAFRVCTNGMIPFSGETLVDVLHLLSAALLVYSASVGTVLTMSSVLLGGITNCPGLVFKVPHSVYDVCADKTIIEQFATCEQNAQQRSANKRKGSMNRIKRLDGVSPQFSKKSRERIPAAVIARIKELNWMDVELHEVATEMATAMIKKARANGMTVCYPLVTTAAPCVCRSNIENEIATVLWDDT